MADSSYRETDAVIDEVTLLEAALREAVGRRRAGITPEMSPSREVAGEVLKEHIKYDLEARNFVPGADPSQNIYLRQRFDSAVAAYGVQLKGWIDMQVDARVTMMFRSLVEGELMVAQQESRAAVTGVQALESDIEVLKGTQAKLLAVVEGISEELARVKNAVSACQLSNQLQSAAAKQVDMEALRRWVEESQGGLAEELQAAQLRLVSELRAETTAAFRSEASAVAALDEQLWLTDQRLGQRIDELARSHRESVTIVERRNGSPDKVVEDVVEDVVKESSTIHIRPPQPIGISAGEALSSKGNVRVLRSAGGKLTVSERIEEDRSLIGGRSHVRLAGGMAPTLLGARGGESGTEVVTVIREEAVGGGGGIEVVEEDQYGHAPLLSGGAAAFVEPATEERASISERVSIGGASERGSLVWGRGARTG